MRLNLTGEKKKDTRGGRQRVAVEGYEENTTKKSIEKKGSRFLEDLGKLRGEQLPKVGGTNAYETKLAVCAGNRGKKIRMDEGRRG